MRAIISCKTPLTDDEIKEVLDDINWRPFTCISTAEKTNPNAFFESEIKKQKFEIIRSVPDENQDVLRETTFCTIFDGETKTWGIVSRVNKYRIKIRLKNPLSNRLKKACESLIKQLRSNVPKITLDIKKVTIPFLIVNYIPSKIKYLKNLKFVSSNENNDDSNAESDNGNGIESQNDKLIGCNKRKKWLIFVKKKFFILRPNLFEFYPVIQVLEKDSEHESFHGEILHQNLLAATISEKLNQTLIVAFTGMVTIILFIYTSPLSKLYYDKSDWGIYYNGALGRISTATLLTCSIGIIEIILHWRKLIKEAPIKWSANEFDFNK